MIEQQYTIQGEPHSRMNQIPLKKKGIEFNVSSTMNKSNDPLELKNQYFKHVDPFVCLTSFDVVLPAGFYDHPHRGQQTITYCFQGKLMNEDSTGVNCQSLPGEIVYWNTGKGVVHSQVPLVPQERVVGLQIWMNQKKCDKMKDHVFKKCNSEFVRMNGKYLQAKVLIGTFEGIKGCIETTNPALMVDVILDKGAQYEFNVLKNWNSMVFSIDGFLKVQKNQMLGANDLSVFKLNKKQDEVLVFEALEENARFIILAGESLDEPLLFDEHFLMNSQEELIGAYNDFENKINGFESSQNWVSEMMKKIIIK